MGQHMGYYIILCPRNALLQQQSVYAITSFLRQQQPAERAKRLVPGLQSSLNAYEAVKSSFKVVISILLLLEVS